ncbi:alcohol dehydrogenase [Mycobacterium sp. MS1601]|uniref:zinc-binding dehydrogenase n=1 Tax=Mycobacterium sp. MS1601 TaxID=1936029 RepID=UPI0009793BCE|nr:zinc-binding dehydrogenase [Mycobacterium sp. MS1601]AQA02653.1 alcohol dehydrogenase [Mycobacterium sp. MS1601]
MRASVLRNGAMVLRDDVPDPVPGPGQVLVEVRACGICGSDLHFARHGAEMIELARQVRDTPMNTDLDLDADVFMGHEFSAEILEAGPETDAPAPGTLVTSQPILVSGDRIDGIVFSNTVIGGYAERMLLSAPLLLPVPNGLDARRAALTEPLAVGIHAVNKSRIRPDDTAVVIGAGPVGISIIAALRAAGVESVVAADFSPVRRTLAQTMGASRTVDPAMQSPFDVARPSVVFEAVGVPGIIDEAIRMAPSNCRLVSVGASMQPDTVRPAFAAMKNITVQFVFGHSPKEFASALTAIADGVVDVSPMITSTVSLDGVGAAFTGLADPERHCKVLVTPQA